MSTEDTTIIRFSVETSLDHILSEDNKKDFQSPRSEYASSAQSTDRSDDLANRKGRRAAELLIRTKSTEKISRKKSSEYLTKANLERHGSRQSINSDDSYSSPDANSRAERRRFNSNKSRERIVQTDSLLSMVSDDGTKRVDRSLSRSKSQGSIRSEEDLSDLDDDDMEDNAETVDWLAEEVQYIALDFQSSQPIELYLVVFVVIYSVCIG